MLNRIYRKPSFSTSWDKFKKVLKILDKAGFFIYQEIKNVIHGKNEG